VANFKTRALKINIHEPKTNSHANTKLHAPNTTTHPT